MQVHALPLNDTVEVLVILNTLVKLGEETAALSGRWGACPPCRHVQTRRDDVTVFFFSPKERRKERER